VNEKIFFAAGWPWTMPGASMDRTALDISSAAGGTEIE
jgi:hypothetical protein